MRQPNRWQLPLTIVVTGVVGFLLRAYVPPMPMWLMIVLLVVFSGLLVALVIYARRRVPRVEAKR